MNRFLLFACFGALVPLAAARTFTNQKGQSFEGTLASVDSANAEMLGKDGKKYKVALSALSDADRKFCTDWLAANPPMKLTIKAEGFTAKGTRQTENAASGNGSTSTVSRTRTLQEGYHITISNWSKDPKATLAGLKVEYAIVVGFSNTAGKDKRGVKEVVKGSVAVPELTGTKAQIVDTKTVGTGQSAAVASRTTTDSDGDSATSTAAAVYRESMDGICLVVKHGDRVVSTYTTGKVPKEVQLEMAK
jgi:hypothetical protein